LINELDVVCTDSADADRPQSLDSICTYNGNANSNTNFNSYG